MIPNGVHHRHRQTTGRGLRRPYVDNVARGSAGASPSHRGTAAVANGRLGATLTEVLMALLIMSVGVISVFSLYPIAVLRSIQATQLTNSKILSENAIAEILGDPAMINGAPAWRPNVDYRVGDLVTAVPSIGRTTVDGAARYLCVNQDADGDTIREGNGTSEPDWPAVRNTPVVDGDVIWILAADPNPASVAPFTVPDGNAWPPTPPGYGAIEDGRDLAANVFVVDPLGWAQHQSAGNPSLRDSYGTAPRLDAGLRGLIFGNRSIAYLTGSPLAVESIYQPLFGVGSGGFATAAINEGLTLPQLLRVARARVSLPDSYESSVDALQPTSVETNPLVSPAVTTVTLPVSPETTSFLSAIDSTVTALQAASQPQLVRIVLEASDANDPGSGPISTVSRWVTPGSVNPAAGQITVAAIFPENFGFPPESTGAVIPMAGPTSTNVLVNSVRIEVNESRFTWFATFVKDTSGATRRANCVVMFRRSFETSIEQGYECALGNDPLVAGAGAAVDADRAWIRAAEGGVPAEIIVGRHLFDSFNGLWYEITAVVATNQGPDANITVVQLDRAVEVPIANDGMGVAGNVKFVSDPQVVIPRGVIKVFPLSLDR